MSLDWMILFALLFFVALGVWVYRQRQPKPPPRENQFNLTLSRPVILDDPLWNTLTARQQQVARLAARGLSSMEIANRLGVKLSTVDSHLKNIYDKLQVHSRGELSYRIKDQIDRER